MNIAHGIYDGNGVLLVHAGVLQHSHQRSAILNRERAGGYGGVAAQ